MYMRIDGMVIHQYEPLIQAISYRKRPQIRCQHLQNLAIVLTFYAIYIHSIILLPLRYRPFENNHDHQPGVIRIES